MTLSRIDKGLLIASPFDTCVQETPRALAARCEIDSAAFMLLTVRRRSWEMAGESSFEGFPGVFGLRLR